MKKFLVVLILVAAPAAIFAQYLYTSSTGQAIVGCPTLEALKKQSDSSLQSPSLLLDGYEYKCGKSTGHEMDLTYGPINFHITKDRNKNLANGFVFFKVYDEAKISGQSFSSKNATDLVTGLYQQEKTVNQSSNISLQSINGKTAFVRDGCLDCGVQTAKFQNETPTGHTFQIPSQVLFIDGSIVYNFEAFLPSSTLVQIAQSIPTSIQNNTVSTKVSNGT